MSLPGIFKDDDSSGTSKGDKAEATAPSSTMMICDTHKVISDKKLIEAQFADYKITYASDAEALQNAVKSEKADAGGIDPIQSDPEASVIRHHFSVRLPSALQ